MRSAGANTFRADSPSSAPVDLEPDLGIVILYIAFEINGELFEAAILGRGSRDRTRKCGQSRSGGDNPAVVALHDLHVTRSRRVAAASRNSQAFRQRASAATEAEIECRQDKQVEQRRCHEAAQNDDRHRIFDLVARQVAENDQRQNREPGRAGRHQDRP